MLLAISASLQLYSPDQVFALLKLNVVQLSYMMSYAETIYYQNMSTSR